MNSAHYWIWVTYAWKLLSFDMGKEVFELVKLAHFPYTKIHVSARLFLLSDIDRISSWITDESTSYHNIWVKTNISIRPNDTRSDHLR